MVKSYNLPIDYVLYEMSYANLIMYSAVIPSYESKKDGKDKRVIDADNPQNKNIVNKLIFG